MSAARYTELGVLLEDRIYFREYSDKLPAQRDLQKEFSAAPATVSRAIQLLERGKLLLPGGATPRCGMRINKYVRSRKRGVIALVTRTTSLLPAMDWLENRCRKDGFEVERVVFDAPLHFGHPEPRFFKRFTGVIFLLSSITVELALYLKELKIPFVAANYLPMMLQMDMVEWDHEACWEKIIIELKKKNYRKVELTFPGLIENYFSFQTKLYLKILRRNNMSIPSMDKQLVPDRNLSNSQNLQQIFKYFSKKNNFPEALMIWNGGVLDLLEELCDKYHAPEDMLMIIPVESIEPIDSKRRIFQVKSGDYQRLFLAAYRNLRQRMLAPDMAYKHEFVPYAQDVEYDFPYNKNSNKTGASGKEKYGF